ncbi:MAG: hypothetical protein BTN85_0798 [Candidatus Methanohalarchaeum thermophilum]|uniref:Uncharacterized protein n=1 Tax=Methanohalarchaeum thermophilum TaxID=1903181 RepID=A0A1Q6DVA2_METT1|nr:MAG: hypothetical protein BTN85_0798 [Candidatus Methanohalarchaeum thermophilum]
MNFEVLTLDNKEKRDLLRILFLIATILVAFIENKSTKIPFFLFLLVGLIQYIFILNKETKRIEYRAVNIITSFLFSVTITTPFVENLQALNYKYSKYLQESFHIMVFIVYLLVLWAILFLALKQRSN